MPKRYLTGGGKRLKNQTKSNSYLDNILKKITNLKKILTFARYDRIGEEDSRTTFFNLVTRVARIIHSTFAVIFEKIPFFKKILTFARYDRIGGGDSRARCDTWTQLFRKIHSENKLLNPRGAILIEFAVCMPILIILLFYIHDLVKIKRYYSQTEFVAQQMANILQNLAKKRHAEGTTLKYEDLCNAASLAYLTIYPGKTMYSSTANQKKHEFIHCPFFYVYYVQGTSEGKAKCLWGKGITTDRTATPLWYNFHNISSNVSSSVVAYDPNEVNASSIYPTLKVENSQPKIIIETALFWGSKFMNNSGKSVSTARQAFGLYFVNPKRRSDLYFNSAVIFSPNNGFPQERPDS